MSGTYGDWENAAGSSGTAPYRKINASNNASITGNSVEQKLLGLSNTTSRIENNLRLYGKAEDSSSFRKEMTECRDRGYLLVRELAPMFRRNKPRDDKDRRAISEFAQFSVLMDRFEKAANQSLQLEREHQSFTASFATSFTGSFMGSSQTSLLSPHPEHRASDLSSTSLQYLQEGGLSAVQRIDIDEKVRREQIGELTFYRDETSNLREMMEDLGMAVKEDQSMLDQISTHIDKTTDNVIDVVETLEDAEKLNRKVMSRKWCWMCFIILLVLVVGGVMAYMVLGKH